MHLIKQIYYSYDINLLFIYQLFINSIFVRIKFYCRRIYVIFLKTNEKFKFSLVLNNCKTREVNT